MSDVIKSPNTGASNQTPAVKEAASKWRVVLAVCFSECGLFDMACQLTGLNQPICD